MEKPTIEEVFSDNELSKQALEFVKNNCLTWCKLDHCIEQACQKPHLKEEIINTQI